MTNTYQYSSHSIPASKQPQNAHPGYAVCMEKSGKSSAYPKANRVISDLV